MGNLQIRITFFVVCIGVNYNRWLSNYTKITRFTMFLTGGEGGLCKPPTVSRRGSLPKLNYCLQEGRDYKFWTFCDNIIIECSSTMSLFWGYS